MTDAKSRKVIILEGTFMPTYVKDAIAQALFDNLRVSLGQGYRGRASADGRYPRYHSHRAVY
jgi:hypothetical protein